MGVLVRGAQQYRAGVAGMGPVLGGAAVPVIGAIKQALDPDGVLAGTRPGWCAGAGALWHGISSRRFPKKVANGARFCWTTFQKR
jgi:hypothetical protein